MKKINQPREWGKIKLSSDAPMTRLFYEEFIHPACCCSETDFRNKVRFIETGQYIQRLDAINQVHQWHRLMIAKQNQNFENKFWLVKYAAELDMHLYKRDQKQLRGVLDLPIPVRATLLIQSQWAELKNLFEKEYNT